MVEMLVSVAIMGFVAAAFLGAMLINYKTSGKVSNMMDNVNTIRAIKERISRDVREGRFIGSVYGGGDVWPALGVDPIYGAAQAPPNGWPTGWPTSYTINNDTLVVQIPVLDDHNDSAGAHNVDNTRTGWPTMIAAGQGNPPTPENVENVETHVYRIVPDPNNAGEWRMEFASFPGMAVGSYQPAAHSFGPQVILSGIIGPIDPGTAAPKVFQYLDKTNVAGANAGRPRDEIVDANNVHNGALASNYTGVVVNIEVRRHQTSSLNRRDISIQPIGMKMEVFLRNNALATVAGN